MEQIKEACLRAIRFDQKNPKIELKYPVIYDNVILTLIGPIEGYRVRQEGLFDVYEFNARVLYEYLTDGLDRSVAE